MSIKDRVAIIGTGCTKFGEHYDKSAEDLVVEAGLAAMADAGVDRGQIQAGWVGTLSSSS